VNNPYGSCLAEVFQVKKSLDFANQVQMRSSLCFKNGLVMIRNTADLGVQILFHSLDFRSTYWLQRTKVVACAIQVEMQGRPEIHPSIGGLKITKVDDMMIKRFNQLENNCIYKDMKSFNDQTSSKVNIDELVKVGEFGKMLGSELYQIKMDSRLNLRLQKGNFYLFFNSWQKVKLKKLIMGDDFDLEIMLSSDESTTSIELKDYIKDTIVQNKVELDALRKHLKVTKDEDWSNLVSADQTFQQVLNIVWCEKRIPIPKDKHYYPVMFQFNIDIEIQIGEENYNAQIDYESVIYRKVITRLLLPNEQTFSENINDLYYVTRNNNSSEDLWKELERRHGVLSDKAKCPKDGLILLSKVYTNMEMLQCIRYWNLELWKR
jgi:hypothetical protein